MGEADERFNRNVFGQPLVPCSSRRAPREDEPAARELGEHVYTSCKKTSHAMLVWA